MPTLADAWHSLSVADADLGQFRDALAEIDSALIRSPQEPRFHFQRGVILSRMDSSRSAFESFATATRLNERQPEFWGALAIVSWHLGRDREAVAFWGRALELSPSYFADRPDERSWYDRSVAAAGPQPAATLQAIPP